MSPFYLRHTNIAVFVCAVLYAAFKAISIISRHTNQRRSGAIASHATSNHCRDMIEIALKAAHTRIRMHAHTHARTHTRARAHTHNNRGIRYDSKRLFYVNTQARCPFKDDLYRGGHSRVLAISASRSAGLS